MVDHHVAVAPGIAFGAAGEGHLRICFAQSAERIERAMGRLRDGLRDVAADDAWMSSFAHDKIQAVDGNDSPLSAIGRRPISLGTGAGLTGAA